MSGPAFNIHIGTTADLAALVKSAEAVNNTRAAAEALNRLEGRLAQREFDRLSTAEKINRLKQQEAQLAAAAVRLEGTGNQGGAAQLNLAVLQKREQIERLTADPAEFASLASNAFSAAQAMSRRLKENYFTQLRVTGATFQTLIWQVDETCLFIVVFPADMDAKKVEDQARVPVINLYELLKIARHRAPEATLDLADEDAESFTKFFRRTPPADPPPPTPPGPPAA